LHRHPALAFPLVPCAQMPSPIAAAGVPYTGGEPCIVYMAIPYGAPVPPAPLGAMYMGPQGPAPWPPNAVPMAAAASQCCGCGGGVGSPTRVASMSLSSDFGLGDSSRWQASGANVGMRAGASGPGRAYGGSTDIGGSLDRDFGPEPQGDAAASSSLFGGHAGIPKRGPGSAPARRRRRQRALGQFTLSPLRQEAPLPSPQPTGPCACSSASAPPPLSMAAAAAAVSGESRRFLAERIAELLASDDEAARAEAIEALKEPHVAQRLSFDAHGCRVVQLALEVADRQAAAEFAGQLRTHVVEATRSPHANYVLQKVVKVLLPQEVPFIVEELSTFAPELARHEYGCRIFCRLLEHAAASSDVASLLDAALGQGEDLLRHTFGHYVVECALEHGQMRQRQAIVAALLRNPLRNAWNRNAAYVVEKALLYSCQDDRRILSNAFAAAPASELVALARNQFGSMVVRALLRQPFDSVETIREALCAPSAIVQLRGTKHGRRLLEDRAFGLLTHRDHAGSL